MYIIMLGAPGAGKGTQAELLKNKLGVPQISTGELFRHEMEIGSDLGNSVRETMDGGKLVSDDTTLEIFEKRILKEDCSRGAIIDGVPRTIKQAELLGGLFQKLGKSLETVLYISLPENEIITRLSGRWTCKKCGHVYHEQLNPPKIAHICDIDGCELYQRDDQKPEAILERIEVYKTSTYPLVEYYKSLLLLKEIDGNQEIEKVHQQILRALNLK